MSKENVEALLIKGGKDRQFRIPYDEAADKEQFIALAKNDGFEFTIEELDAVLREEGEIFDSNGNPPKRGIWWVD